MKCKYPNEVCGNMTMLDENILTNYNRILSMGVKEMAEFLKDEMYNDFKPSCKNSTFFSADTRPECDENCVDCQIRWLNSQAE